MFLAYDKPCAKSSLPLLYWHTSEGLKAEIPSTLCRTNQAPFLQRLCKASCCQWIPSNAVNNSLENEKQRVQNIILSHISQAYILHHISITVTNSPPQQKSNPWDPSTTATKWHPLGNCEPLGFFPNGTHRVRFGRSHLGFCHKKPVNPQQNTMGKLKTLANQLMLKQYWQLVIAYTYYDCICV